MPKNRATKRNLEDWEKWLQPYVEKKLMVRRANQYSKDNIKTPYYSVGVVPIEIMIKNKARKSLKYRVSGFCKVCNKRFETLWSNFVRRKNDNGKIVCGHCSRRKQYNSTWKKNNSEAQKKVQGTLEARKKMSKILKKKHKENPEIAEKISRGLKKTYEKNPSLREKISKASLENWKNPEYQAKVSPVGFHHGIYNSRFGEIYFASSWELMFVVWCEKNDNVIGLSRCKDRIKYKKPCGNTAYYHPDFSVITVCGKYTVEIKGKRNIELVERKKQAAIEYYDKKTSYVILFKNELKELGCFLSSKKIKPWVMSLVDKGKVTQYGFGKKEKDC